ncbi:MAG: hypothetical protein MSS48_08090, partial [Clostridiales bacterium]|nr:hypothetical protein [Clostridiales bacterium]
GPVAGGNDMKVEITPKEIADLVRDSQSQPEKVVCEVNVDSGAIAQAVSSAIRDSLAKDL